MQTGSFVSERKHRQNPTSKNQWKVNGLRGLALFIHSNSKRCSKPASPSKFSIFGPHLDFNKVHIEGAHSLPSSEVSAETLLCTRELLPTEPLYLVSESGALAQLQADELERQGLDNVVVVAGGMCGWWRDGLPIERHGRDALVAAGATGW